MLSILEGFLEEAREMVSPLRNPIVRQDKSCHGADVATGQPSLCGGQGTPPACPLASGTFLGSAEGSWQAHLPWSFPWGHYPQLHFFKN